MSDFNKYICTGRVTRDPQVRFTTSGTAVCDLGLAVNQKFKDKETTTFLDVTLFGRTAEVAAQYLTKGKSVLIEGRLQLDTWDDRESGQKRSKLKVIGETMTMLGGGGGKSDRPEQRTEQPSQPDDFDGGTPDDVPF